MGTALCGTARAVGPGVATAYIECRGCRHRRPAVRTRRGRDRCVRGHRGAVLRAPAAPHPRGGPDPGDPCRRRRRPGGAALQRDRRRRRRRGRQDLALPPSPTAWSAAASWRTPSCATSRARCAATGSSASPSSTWPAGRWVAAGSPCTRGSRRWAAATCCCCSTTRTHARRLEEVRRDFVANVSHELKTPVGGLALLAEAVLDARDDPEAVERFARRMQVESARLSQLVKEIVELSRLQVADTLHEPRLVDLDRGGARGHRALARRRGGRADRARRGLRARPQGLRRRPSCSSPRCATSSATPSPTPTPATRVAVGGRAQRRPRRGHRHRPGPRHPRERAGPHLRALLPRRRRPLASHRRHRPRAGHRQAHLRQPRRRRHASGARRAAAPPSRSACPLPRTVPTARRAATSTRSPHRPPRGPGMTRILVVEDEDSFSDPLSYLLRKEGYEVGGRRDRARGPGGVRPHRRRPRPARPHAARAVRRRRVPCAAAALDRAGDHADRQGQRDRQGGRAGDRRRRLRHQALLLPRAAGPDQGRAAPARRARGARCRPPSRPARCGWTSSATWSRSTARRPRCR